MAEILTSALVAATPYTTLAVTAMTVAVPSGGVVWVGLNLPTVESFTTSAGVSVGDTTLHVTSHAPTSNHAIGEQVAPDYTLTAVGRTLAPIQAPRTRRL